MTITIPDASALDVTGELSVGIWANLAPNTEDVHALVTKSGVIRMVVGVGDANNPGFRVEIGDGTNYNYTIEDSQVWIDDHWHFFAFTFLDDSRARLYVDGNKTSEDTSVSKSLSTNSNDLLIGEDPKDNWNLTGDVDDLRWWSEERSQSNIQDQRMIDLTGNEANLNGYWPMNDPSTKTVKDKTPNDNDGTLDSTGEYVQRTTDNTDFFKSPDGEADTGLSKPLPPEITNSDTYDSKGGATRAYIDVTVEPLQRKAKYQRLIYRRQGASNWNEAAELQNYNNPQTVQIAELSPTVAWEVGVRSYSSVSTETIVTEAINSPFTTSTDSSAPSAPTGLAVTVGTGQALEVTWDANSKSADDFNEYYLYRSKNNNNFSNATKIAELQSTTYIDTDVTIGDTFYYWVSALDESNNESSQTGAKSDVPIEIPDDQTDSDAPQKPSQPTLSNSTTEVADDGTVVSSIDATIDGLTSLAKMQNLLLRRQGSSEWNIQDQRENSSSTTITIDDLKPGKGYEVAVQSFSYPNVPSPVSDVDSSVQFTADVKNTDPADVTGFTVSQEGAEIRLKWDDNPDNDLKYYEIKRRDNGASTTFADAVAVTNSVETEIVVPSIKGNYEFMIKAVDTSGNKSTNFASDTEDINFTKTFTSDTTWTVPSNVKSVFITAVGGGGGGGGGGAGDDQQSGQGGGGGGSGTTKILKEIDVTPGDAISVTIGNGGAGGSGSIGGNSSETDKGGDGGDGGQTSFGGKLTVEGGKGGVGGRDASNTSGYGTGGAPASPEVHAESGGDGESINGLEGADGGYGASSTQNARVSGGSGATSSSPASKGTNGKKGAGGGGGGSGADRNDIGNEDGADGGDGGDGQLIIQY